MNIDSENSDFPARKLVNNATHSAETAQRIGYILALMR